MPVIESTKDVEALTMTMVVELAATPERAWQLWEDPRQLERWWGPPEWPATFHEHRFEEGGRSRYYMTGPDGTRAHGWWQFTHIQAPDTLSLEDGFADDTGEPTDEHGTMLMTTTFEPVGAGTRMTVITNFTSADQLERMLKMGMQEGMRLALGQIDDILAS
jgi:uncharacterized protein YndB with AHSA1/START domain